MQLFLFMLKYFLLFLLCISVTTVFGQDVFKGQVYEIKTHIGLSGIEVHNMANKAVTMTNDKGGFSISAKKGDLLILKAFSYQPDTVLITSMTLQEIYLIPRSNMLKEVKVVTDSTKNFSKPYYDPQFHGQPVVYQRDDNLNYKGGIAIRFHDSHGSEKQRAKLAKEMSDQKAQDEINKTFSPTNVAKFLPLKGQDIYDFIALYTPTTDQFQEKGFSLLLYLNDSYKKFLQLSPEERHLGRLPNDTLPALK